MTSALIILAHPDDEAYGPAGTISQLATTMPVVAVVLCSGKRPGAEHVASIRQIICRDNLHELGVRDVIFHENDDTRLDFYVANTIISEAVMKYKPSVVFVHSGCDLHMDHRTAYEATLVACRPTPACPVNELYTFEIPGSSEWAFGQYGEFRPTMYIDVSKQMELKRTILRRYVTETYPYPDSRSVDSMVITAAARGKTMGMEYAEAFQLVYARHQSIV